jgi:hypothetical protein
MPDEVEGWRQRDILSGCRRRCADEQGRSLPPPAPQASLSLFRPYKGSYKKRLVMINL